MPAAPEEVSTLVELDSDEVEEALDALPLDAAELEALADADELADESDVNATWLLGSYGCDMNRGTTYNATSAMAATATTMPIINGNFDFFFSDAGFASPPEDE